LNSTSALQRVEPGLPRPGRHRRRHRPPRPSLNHPRDQHRELPPANRRRERHCQQGPCQAPRL